MEGEGGRKMLVRGFQRQASAYGDGSDTQASATNSVAYGQESGGTPLKARGTCSEEQCTVSSRERITSSFEYLMDQLYPELVADHMIQDFALSSDDYDYVCVGDKSRRDRCWRFLQLLMRKDDAASYSSFKQALRKAGCGHVADELESTDSKSLSKTGNQRNLARLVSSGPGNLHTDISDYIKHFDLRNLPASGFGASSQQLRQDLLHGGEMESPYLHIIERSMKDLLAPGHEFEDHTIQRTAIRLIEKNGMLVICGSNSFEASSLGHSLLKHYCNQGYTPIIVGQVGEWNSVARSGKQKIILLEHVFGEDALEEGEFDNWVDIVSNLTGLLAQHRCLLIITLTPRIMKEIEAKKANFFGDMKLLPLDRQNQTDKSGTPVRLRHHSSQKHKKHALYSDTQGVQNTPVHNACYSGNLEFLRMAIDTASFSLSARNKAGETPLDAACNQGNVDIVCYLLKMSVADLSEISPEYLDVDHIMKSAVYQGRTDLVEHLLDLGADPEMKDEAGCTPLHWACLENRVSVAELLIQRSHDGCINVTDSSGCTPLHEACIQGHTEIAQMLISKSASLELFDQTGRTPLHIATSQNHVDLIQLLIKSGVNINVQTKTVNQTSLHLASVDGNTDTLKALIELGAQVNPEDDSLSTPLHLAAENGREATVEVLLEMAANADAKDCKGLTPLHRASGLNHVRSMEVLLKHNVYVDSTDLVGRSALHVACEEGHVDAAAVLVKHGANITLGDRNWFTPLHLASQHYHSEVIAVLLYNVKVRAVDLAADMWKRLDINTSVTTKDGNTPLHLACQAGSMVVTWTLLTYGVDGINALNEEGDTALHLACAEGHSMIVESLLSVGAKSSATNGRRWTPLHCACRHGQHDTVKLLLVAGADVDTVDVKGQAALHLACAAGHRNVVDILLRYGADTEIRDAFDRRPLHISCENRDAEIVTKLLENYALTNARDKYGETALHKASRHGYSEIVSMLLQPENKTDIDSENNKQYTALHLACQSGHATVAEILIHHGADINRVTLSKHTPLHFASENGHQNVVELLVKSRASQGSAADLSLTPLGLATFNGHFNIVKVLLESDDYASLEAAHQDRMSALHLAADQGNSRIVQLLLSYESVAKSVRDVQNALFFLVLQKSHAEVLKIFLAHGFNKDLKAPDGSTPLSLACTFCNFDVVQTLLDHGCSVNTQDKLGVTPLHAASANGHVRIVEMLLKMGASPTVPTVQGVLPLHSAAFSGHEAVVQVLLQQQLPVDAEGPLGLTPLHMACFQGHKGVADILIKHGADKEKRDENKAMPLHYTMYNIYPELARFLLESGVGIDVSDGNGNTPLHVACFVGNIQIISVLLEYGAAVNITNNRGFTPLLFACLTGQEEVVNTLIQHGANFTLASNDSLTPLSAASQKGHVRVVHSLLRLGAGFAETKRKNVTSALYFASYFGHVNIVSLLLKYKLPVNEIANGTNALFAACENGNTDIAVVKLLLDHGANKNHKDVNGDTALHQACFRGFDNVVRVLLENVADPNETDIVGNTPLHFASSRGHLDVVNTLLGVETVRVDVLNSEEMSALHLACCHGHQDIVKTLIKHGAKKDMKTGGIPSVSPLQIACYNGHGGVINVLLEGGVKTTDKKWKGKTPLHFVSSSLFVKSHSLVSGKARACVGDVSEVVRVLLKHGMDVKAADSEGNTPLHAACLAGCADTVQAFIKHGADLNIRNYAGLTPVGVAAKKGHEHVVKILKDFSGNAD